MRQRESSLSANYFISVVIPAYNQQKTIVDDVAQIENALQELGYKYEVIVVDDGSTDETFKRVSKLKSAHVKIVGYPENQGKGHAIQYGMLHAKGEIIGYIDAGMDIHTKGFAMLLQHMDWYNADVIVGSKMHPVSIVQYPLWRKIFSWGYRLLTRKMFGFKVLDTQVGLKFFKRKVVQDVIPRLLVKQYAFDIEMLAVAYRLGYKRIYEAPIEINFRENSITKFRIWSIVYKMLWDTCAVFYRLKILRYYDKVKKKQSDLDAMYIQPLYQKK